LSNLIIILKALFGVGELHFYSAGRRMTLKRGSIVKAP